ncbi:hypothetical protein PVK06_011357 [Gossypium arboreum]|uniref:Uncharacterized protein n=1 Tax=Gossypium arboreum TaxID=29729 RepID=A0ABR0Q8P5_GOSAR|nr:hypothetical protein PVK06_011357 [Gossypium arboreum]
MKKGGSSREVEVEAPKFKRRKASAVRDFSPGCERGTTSDFKFRRQIAADQSSQGKYRLFFGCIWAGNYGTEEVYEDRMVA